MDKKIKIIQYSVASFIGLVMFFIYALLHEMFVQDSFKGVIGLMSNGFLIPGLILILSGLLTLVAKTGFFDIMGYGFRSLWILCTPSKRALQERKTFYEYKEEKNAGTRHWYPFLCFTGLGFVLLAIIADIIYVCI